MKYIFSLLIIALTITSCSSQSDEDRAVIEYAKEAEYNIKGNDVKNTDPAILFCYSNYLFEKGEQDEAAFWYYVAQYRYRFMSSCSEKGKAGSYTNEEAKKIYKDANAYRTDIFDDIILPDKVYRINAYEAIQKVLGAKINGYAYGDLEQMKIMIDRMLAYQQENPFNPMGLDPKPVLKSKDIQAEKIEKIKESYGEQKKQITNDADYIKKTRLENGLENRN